MTGRSRSLDPRTALAISSGRFIRIASQRLGRGGGTALPGLVAERIQPSLIRQLSTSLGAHSALITGTNGKTTTAHMLAAIGRAAGRHIVHNRSGSNLMRGLATTLLDHSDVWGRIPDAAESLGILEVDEATMLPAIPAVRPHAVVFTNLFRDQLDRYGEVDSIISIWQRALQYLDASAVLVLNADDPGVAGLASQLNLRTVFYGVDDTRCAGEAEHAADARWCRICDSEYRYDALYFGHIGLWMCPNCGMRRPSPGVLATRVEMVSPSSTELEVHVGDERLTLSVPLTGLYNVYNVLAAVGGAVALELPKQAIVEGLRNLTAAFGRQENLKVQGREVRIFLSKNPAGANQALRTVAMLPGEKSTLFLLNDGIADGRDVSWIWDVDYEILSGQIQFAIVSGRRAADLALRLKYAGLNSELALEEDTAKAVTRALEATPRERCLYIFPTYTAMLDVREQLARLGGYARFWEESREGRN